MLPTMLLILLSLGLVGASGDFAVAQQPQRDAGEDIAAAIKRVVHEFIVNIGNAVSNLPGVGERGQDVSAAVDVMVGGVIDVVGKGVDGIIRAARGSPNGPTRVTTTPFLTTVQSRRRSRN